MGLSFDHLLLYTAHFLKLVVDWLKDRWPHKRTNIIPYRAAIAFENIIGTINVRVRLHAKQSSWNSFLTVIWYNCAQTVGKFKSLFTNALFITYLLYHKKYKNWNKIHEYIPQKVWFSMYFQNISNYGRIHSPWTLTGDQHSLGSNAW